MCKKCTLLIKQQLLHGPILPKRVEIAVDFHKNNLFNRLLAKFRTVFDEVSRYPIVQQAVGQTLISNCARGSSYPLYLGVCQIKAAKLRCLSYCLITFLVVMLF